MTKTYKASPVERFMEVIAHGYLSPETKAKTLTAIVYSMNIKEIDEARAALTEKLGDRIRHLQELNAPKVLIDLQEDVMHRYSAYLNRAEKRLGQETT